MSHESEKSGRRNHLERIQDIFAFIEKQPDVFPKSQFKEIGLNPKTAEMWLKLIEFIQNQPKIRLVQTEHNLLVEKVEGKYQAMMLRKSLDESVPFEQRLQYLTDYLKSQYTREKIKGPPSPPLQKKEEQIGTPSVRDTFTQILDAFATFSLLDPNFEQYARLLRELGSNPSDEEMYVVLPKWQKKVLMDQKFQSDLKRILSEAFYTPRLGEITHQVPDFIEKLKQAKKTIKAYYAFLHENMADWFFTDDME